MVWHGLRSVERIQVVIGSSDSQTADKMSMGRIGFQEALNQIRDGDCAWINTRTHKSYAQPSTANMAGPSWITSGVARSLLEIARELVPIGP